MGAKDNNKHLFQHKSKISKKTLSKGTVRKLQFVFTILNLRWVFL